MHMVGLEVQLVVNLLAQNYFTSAVGCNMLQPLQLNQAVDSAVYTYKTIVLL